MANYDRPKLKYGLDVVDALRRELEKGLETGYASGPYVREKLELLGYVADMLDQANTEELRGG